MANLGRKIAWAVLGTATTKLVRRAARRALHTPGGATRLPAPVRRRDDFGTALGLAVGTGALLAVADVLREQGKLSARRRTYTGPIHPRYSYPDPTRPERFHAAPAYSVPTYPGEGYAGERYAR